MKIWILTAKFGSGHYFAAKALEEDFIEKGYEVVISDIIQVVYPNLYNAIYDTFNKVICRNSSIYNFVNSFGRNPKDKEISKSHAKRILNEMNEVNPDFIVTTWSACSRLVNGCFDRFGFRKPMYVCITDTGIHSGWLEGTADGYLVADHSVKEKLIQLGKDGNNIFVYGIPVRNVFKQPYYIKNKNRNKKLLIIGGGLGIFPWIGKVLKEIDQHQGLDITVITGINKKSFNKIKHKYPYVNVVGFTKHVDKYLKEADLFISKPGGVSLFEGIYTQTPCVFVLPRFEHEKENAKFVCEKHIGEVIWSKKNIGVQIIRLLKDENKRMQYCENIKRTKMEITKEVNNFLAVI